MELQYLILKYTKEVIIDGGCEDGDIILIDSPINVFVRFDFW